MKGRWLALLALVALQPAMVLRAADFAVPGAQGNSINIHLTSLKEAKFRNTIRQKYDFSCGSAAVATLLTYQYGYPVDEQWVFEQMYLHGNQAKIRREGFSLLDIKRFLQTNGFQADGFRVSLQRVEQEGLPAIVLIDVKGYHHFVVIKGIQYGRVLIGDPALGTRALPLSQFKAEWKNGLVFVIHNRRLLAVFNSPADWRAAPLAPLGTGVNRAGLEGITLPKYGPGDI